MSDELNGEVEVSGRELDVAVAERVLGYIVRKVKPNWYDREVTLFCFPLMPERIAYSYDTNACNAMMFRNGVDGSGGYAEPLPFFSEDSEGREWDVVDAMLNKDFLFRLHGYDTSYRGLGTNIKRSEPHREFEAEFLKRGTASEFRLIAQAETPALAICRAALQAVGEEEKGGDAP